MIKILHLMTICVLVLGLSLSHSAEAENETDFIETREIWGESHFYPDSIRKIEVETAKNLYQLINANKNICYGSNTQEDYGKFITPGWDVEIVRTSCEDTLSYEITLVKKDNFTMSEALNAFLAGPTVCECLTIRKIVELKVLEGVFGEKNFNNLFTYYETFLGKKAVSFGSCEKHFLMLLLFQHKSIEEGIKPGNFRYLANAPHYVAKHPLSSYRGDNVVCVEIQNGAPLYLGFGDFYEIPRSQEEIEEHLYREFCSSILESEQRIFDLLDPEICKTLTTNFDLLKNSRIIFDEEIARQNKIFSVTSINVGMISYSFREIDHEEYPEMLYQMRSEEAFNVLFRSIHTELAEHFGSPQG